MKERLQDKRVFYLKEQYHVTDKIAKEAITTTDPDINLEEW
jgi:hypothetical protein